MERVRITENLDFSRIVQGFWRLTGWGMTTEQLTEFIAGCLERGVDTFDAADVYGGGRCETELGKALKAFHREDYKIVTKSGICWRPQGNYYDTSDQHLTEGCKISLDKLGCDYIDLFLVHREDPFIDHAQVADTLLRLKESGVVKEVGVSNFDPQKFSALQKLSGGALCMNQIEWNPLCFEHFNSGMMDLLQAEGIHPMIWSPLAGGALFTGTSEMHTKTREAFTAMAEKYGVEVSTLTYAWIMMHPVKALPIVGSGKLARLDEAIAALDVQLARDDWFTLYKASGQQVIR